MAYEVDRISFMPGDLLPVVLVVLVLLVLLVLSGCFVDL